MGRLVHIVDELAEVRSGTSIILRDQGYETETYASGAAFLARPEPRCGCVLLDLRMPRMDGFEVLAELERRGQELPVIVVTGHADIPLAVRAMKEGAVDFLEQPYEVDDLIQAIERAFGIGARDHRVHEAEAEGAARLASLSPREVEVLQGICAGMANKSIARWLHLSPRTVEAYRATMMAKMCARSVAQLLQMAAAGNLPRIDAIGGRIP